MTSIEAAGDWEAELGETAGAWFSLDLGVVIDGERVPLLPVLAQAMQHLEPGPDGRGRAEIRRAARSTPGLRTGGSWRCRPTACGRCWRP